MAFDKYGNKYEDDEILRLDEETATPGNYGYKFSGARGGSGFYWGRGYGQAGPPMKHRHPKETDSVGFLLRCGVQHHSLNGLPKVLLRLMKPESCGVCAQEFISFDLARLHYISKNHMKNIKKWQAQQAKVGTQHPKEVPLRARGIYCELCDIHITSKSHGDAHYAGKSHHAVVEGRKLPKNPFLLQNNMQERVKQLIRREKRCIKPIQNPAASEKPNPDIKDSKQITPELYCDICQTSVTCTEQMTMHLNGKKHLSKEKRHIFDMMNGETTQLNPAETVNKAKDADAQGAVAQGAEAQGAGAQGAEAQGAEAKGAEAPGADTQGVKAQGTAEENSEDEFDWGHGSGTWDDDPQ